MLPFIGLVFCTGLFYAITTFNTPSIMQNMLTLTEDFGHVERTIIYLFLINFAPIALGLTSLIYNHSLVGMQASADIDIFSVIVLGGYICYLEESRQTPICGFLFVRDLIVIVGCLGGLVSVYIQGETNVELGLILAAFYFVYYVMLQFEEGMEDGVLRLLKIRGNDIYNAEYLLTQNKKESNYLNIKENIEDNQEAVNEDLLEYQEIVQKVIKSQD